MPALYEAAADRDSGLRFPQPKAQGDAPAVVRRGLVENIDEAIKHYQRAIKLNPKKPESFYNLGNAQCVKNEYAAAIVSYQQALDIDAANAPALYNLGNALYMQNRYEDAVIAYQKALKINDRSPECHFNLASAYNDLKDYKLALQHYVRAIELDEDNIDAINSLAQCLKATSSGNAAAIDECFALYQRAIQIDPEDFETNFSLGVLYFEHQRDLDRAILLCDQTLEVTKDDPRSRLRLGAYAMRAEALALQNSPDTGAAFLDAIEPAIELGWRGQIWRILVPLARWWTVTDNRPAAAHMVGCADANTITVAGLDQLADSLSGPNLLAARRRGAQMSYTELLDYIIAELAPVAARGTIERRPGG